MAIVWDDLQLCVSIGPQYMPSYGRSLIIGSFRGETDHRPHGGLSAGAHGTLHRCSHLSIDAHSYPQTQRQVSTPERNAQQPPSNTHASSRRLYAGARQILSRASGRQRWRRGIPPSFSAGGHHTPRAVMRAGRTAVPHLPPPRPAPHPPTLPHLHHPHPRYDEVSGGHARSAGAAHRAPARRRGLCRGVGRGAGSPGGSRRARAKRRRCARRAPS